MAAISGACAWTALRAVPRLLLGAMLCLVMAGRAAMASDPAWPNRPVTLIVSYPPGAIVDTVGRRVAARLGSSLGVPVVIDNRGGAGGNLAAAAVARAAPDGATLLFTSYGNLIIAAAAGLRVGFNPERDLAPVAMVGPMTVVLVIRPALPFQTIGDFVAHARANPGRVNFASVGVGSSYHLFIEQMMAFGRLSMAHVPYRSGAAAMTDLLGGRVDATLATWLFAKPYVADGRVRAIAIANGEGSPVLAGLPTVDAAGVPGARLVDGLGLLAPAGTPAAVVERLNTEMRALIAEPEMARWLTNEGVPPSPMSAEAFGAMLRSEAEPLRRLIREADIRLE